MLDATDDEDNGGGGGGGGDEDVEEDGGRDGEEKEEDTICGCPGGCPGGCGCDCDCDCDCDWRSGEEGGRDGEEDKEDKEEEDCEGAVLGWFDRADSVASLDERFVRKVEEESTSEEKRETGQTQSIISSFILVYGVIVAE